ncbi:MAG: protoporphyrinogen oxidase [Ignavibacteriales bacterium]|nr:protoporphyrinogen oxidase [Ignavibacteriales bacterium]
MDPQNNSTNKHVIIIGGGISGLLTGYWLDQNNIPVTILEQSNVPGGTMKTLIDDGWLVEQGPNSALETTPLISEVLNGLGIESKRIYADEKSSNRYIVRDNTLHKVPMDPLSFIRTKLWSTYGKIRLIKEPFIGRATEEETIAQFVSRRLGKEFLDYAINPFVAGVYAGNPESLSVRYAFPKLYALEEKYGGLIKGMIRSRKERKARKEIAKDRAKLFSFVDGMQTLPNSISQKLGSAVILGATVKSVIPFRTEGKTFYTVSYFKNDETIKLESPVVVFSSPAEATASIIEPIDPEFSKTLKEIYYPPVTELFLGFRSDQVKIPLTGFGFLVPEVEKKNILGTIWSSSLFTNRSPKHHVALTTFVGGARQPDICRLNDEALINRALIDLHLLMKIEGDPVYKKIIRWDRAIPQYNIGFGNVLEKIKRFEDNFRGTFIVSNFKGGIAVGDCFINANAAAKKIADYFILGK